MAAHSTLRVALVALACACFACTSDDGSVETGTGETGTAPLTGAILQLDFDATPLCTGDVERIEYATRRRGCWDPELPCTSPTNSPWEVGTTASCTDLAGSQTWEVGVQMKGQYETQLRALTADDTQEGVNCYAASGTPNGLTQVAGDDVDTERVFELAPTDMGCLDP